MEYQFLKYGESKKWGKCIHIDLFKKKTCSYDCVYCGDGPTEFKTIERVFTAPVNRIFQEISDHIEKNGEPNYIWYSCKGEPTLYLLYGALNKKIKAAYPKVKLASWTNCTLMCREDVCEALNLCDLIIADLDGVIEEEFQRINRPHQKLILDEITSKLLEFRKGYEGIFWLHTVFLKDFNDSNESLKALKKYLLKVKPDVFYISLGIRGAEAPLSEDFKINLEKQLETVPFKYQYE
ncbi:MAG: hypothetical protein KGD59_05020 [Candidatus Heimdallarchaeota archaeon]|nr:hypothetical protein [Candidatus Heimdallarchaeota archaeon]MBY8993890.1 hypothetical protein [Candidatus Heimdallarchaeota archaeon]